MTHSRLPLRFATLCFLLVVSCAALWLPGRGFAQEADNGPYPTQRAAPADDTDPNDRSSLDPQAGNSGNGPANADTGDADMSNSDTNGGDSALGRNGEAAPNPRVGVDTTGRTDATSTRNGGTTRRRLPPVSDNPIRINNSLRGTGDTIVDPDNRSRRLPLPVPSRQTRDYTIPADPTTLGIPRYAQPLPLFGYDFFQPARQIILARRRALLPRPVTTPRRVTRSGTNGRSQSSLNGGRSQAGSATANGNSFGASSDQNNSVPDLTDNGSGQTQSSNDLTDETLGAAAAVTSRRALPQDRNGTDTSDYPPDDNSIANSPDQTTPRGSRAGSQYDNGQNDANSPDNSGQGDQNSANTNPDQNGADANGDMTPRRRRPARNTNDTNSGDAFSGDTAAPGSDIQFPGDDALLTTQNNATNAVTGEIADPIATLYRNVLTSLPPNYQLQPGDLITIQYSALTIAPREFTATVDVQGSINVPEAGRISVAGRTASQAEDTLRLRLERLYRNVNVSISLRQLRTIQVTVSGAAFAPGTYTIPATATAFNVLNAAGGPTANGSLRDIRVLRNSRLVGTLDIYPLIGAASGNPGSKNVDINLQSGDNIYIPDRLSRIAIRGEVRQSAIYELTPRETLRDALNYAGGIRPSGVGQIVHIDTVDPGRGRSLHDVDASNRTAVATVPVYDGDSIEVASVRAILTNRVTISGAVQEPGPYALTQGMRALDLLERAGGTLINTYLGRADLVRTNPDFSTALVHINLDALLNGDATQNVSLKRYDTLQLYSRQDVAYLGLRRVTVRGEVQRPGLYTQSENMRVSDLLLQSGGPLPDAYLNRAVLLHQHGDGTFAYDYVNLASIVSGDTSEDKPIQDNDILAVYRIGEAHFTSDHTVKILGDVVAPGLYARGEGMRLSDLLKVAGSFKPGGGTRVTVAHARRPITDPVTQVAPQTVAFDAQGALGTDLALQDGDVVAVQGNGSLRDHPDVITVTGAVNNPGPIFVTRNMRLSDAVSKAGGLRPEAFPQGAEFTRTSDALVTTGQLDLAQIISRMSDMLNLSQYQRERAKSNLELITAAGAAASGTGSSGGITIPGLTPAANAANPNLAPLTAGLTQNNLVSQGRVLTPSQLQPNGSVAVRLTEALKRPGGTEDVLLKDGDTLVVPETPTTVQIVGAVIRPSGVVFKPGESIDYYIQRAGDFTPDAARDRIEVIHAGGGLIPANKAGAIQPGDLILVPTKVLAEKVSQSGNGFSNFFQGLVGSAITLKVLTSVFGL